MKTTSSKAGGVLQGYFRSERFRGMTNRAPVAQPRGLVRPSPPPPRPELLPVPMRGVAMQARVEREGARAWSGAPRPELLPGMGPSRVGGPRRLAQAKSGHGVTTTPLPLGQLRVIGEGRPLEPRIRQTMERFFEVDFSGVRVHVGQAAPAMGALAFTLGEELHFAPGLYDPMTREGVELLGHELAHVVQQRDGRVANPYGQGVAIVQDPVLEAEADRMGQEVAAEMWPGSRSRRAPGFAKPWPRSIQASKQVQSTQIKQMECSCGKPYPCKDHPSSNVTIFTWDQDKLKTRDGGSCEGYVMVWIMLKALAKQQAKTSYVGLESKTTYGAVLLGAKLQYEDLIEEVMLGQDEITSKTKYEEYKDEIPSDVHAKDPLEAAAALRNQQRAVNARDEAYQLFAKSKGFVFAGSQLVATSYDVSGYWDEGVVSLTKTALLYAKKHGGILALLSMQGDGGGHAMGFSIEDVDGESFYFNFFDPNEGEVAYCDPLKGLDKEFIIKTRLADVLKSYRDLGKIKYCQFFAHE